MHRRRALGVGLAVVTCLASGPRMRSAERPQEDAQRLRAVAATAVRFARTPALRDLPPDELIKPEDVPGDIVKSVPLKTFRIIAEGVPASPDAAVQGYEKPLLMTPSPSLTFEGLSNQDNFSLLGSRVSPPDTVGDVGPNHYVQMTNLAYRVFDKAGTPLTPARTLSSLWASVGGPCATSNDGDPIVLYDSMADRWLLSQFCTEGDPNTHQLIAISQTPDPTGAYYAYDFAMPNEKFNDYPKFGVWHDAYYMTDNQFNQAGTAFLGAGAFAFDRAKMLAGDPAAGYVYFDLESLDPSIGGVLPADLDGLNPPPAGAPAYFSYFTATEFGDAADGLRLFEFHVDFAVPANSTFTERAGSPLAVAAFNPSTPAGRDDIEQPPPATSAAALDAIADRLMHRLAYRNSGTHESLVVTHTVNVGTGSNLGQFRAGIRYYELRRSLSGGAFVVHEQATFAPDNNNRWMGSAALDHAGNLAVGYSVSSLTTFPSIRYAARLATDPPGGLFQGETSLVEGSGVQTGTGSRWGDYSALSVDPVDDCTFWYTNQYYTAASEASSTVGWLTRVGRFKLDECLPISRGTIQGTVTDAATTLPLPGAVVQTSAGHMTVTDAAGHFAFTVAPGTYSVSASKASYGAGGATGVVVVNGGTTVVNIALGGIPAFVAAGASVVAESCGPASGAVDPSETVTVDFAIRNEGAVSSTDLVATLLPGGGVTSPSAPQSYGVLTAGGPAVTRSFTFTADAALTCGAVITATLSLSDGSTSLGTISYALTTGQLGNAIFPTLVSSGDLNQPIPDLGLLNVPLGVVDDGLVSSVTVEVRLDHTYVGDLVIQLVHPDGTVVTLANRRGGSGDAFGTGINTCAGTGTLFDDAAAVPISAGLAPFAGSFRPDMPLAALAGKPASGTWTVRITDQAANDVGVAGCVKLRVNRKYLVCCPFTGGTPVVQAAPPAVITRESCAVANGAPDPDETVFVAFPLRNVGTGMAGKVVARLLAGGGVNSPSAEWSYGQMSPFGPAESREFSFVPSGTCGSTITASLELRDVAGPGLPLGTVTFTFRLGHTTDTSTTVGNPAALTIPSTAGATSGPASLYPSTISVAGITGTVSKVTVTLSGLNHTYPDDLDVLLVGPGGQKLLLMSDAGGGGDVTGVNLTFDDAAAGPLSDSAQVVPGTYKPINYVTGDVFPAPAPADPYPDPQLLSVFNGLNPNGAWSLYVLDDAPGDVGSLAGGWSLAITVSQSACCSQPCTLVCPAPITQYNDGLQSNALVAFTPGVVGSCGVVNCTPPSSSIFPLGTTIDSCQSVSVVSGLPTGACTFPVTIGDVAPPLITGEVASPFVLARADGKLVDVAVNYEACDNCRVPGVTDQPPPTCSLSVTSDEPQRGTGRGDKAPDWQVIDAHRVRLRAERSAKGDGRVYTIGITCRDKAGNRANRKVNVIVPR